MATGACLIPSLAYEDAESAIVWLEKAFGFVCTLKVPGATAGSILHAQLVLRETMMVMVCSDQGCGANHNSSNDNNDGNSANNSSSNDTKKEQKDTLLRSPRAANLCTQGLYLIVEDVAAAYKRARDAGAAVVRPLKEQEYGGCGFTVHDCEGHPWSFGNYNPWQSSQ